MTSPLRAGEQRLLELIHDCGEVLRETQKRWDNRLILKRLPLAEEYINGRLAVALNFNLVMAVEQHPSPHDHDICNRSFNSVLVLIFRVKVHQGGDREDRNQGLMLVENVEVVESVEGKIPSLVLVGAYLVENQIPDVGPRNIYWSLWEGSYKFLTLLPERELGGFDLLVRTPIEGDDLVGHQIQRSVEVVGSIADDRRNALRHRLGHVAYHHTTTGLQIVLNDDSVEVRFPKVGQYPLKLVDVLIGPFDL